MTDLHARLVSLAAQVMRLRDRKELLRAEIEASDVKEEALRKEYSSLMKEYLLQINSTVVVEAKKVVREGTR